MPVIAASAADAFVLSVSILFASFNRLEAAVSTAITYQTTTIHAPKTTLYAQSYPPCFVTIEPTVRRWNMDCCHGEVREALYLHDNLATL